MSRNNTGAKLVIVKQAGMVDRYYISWTVAGRSKRKTTGVATGDPEAAARAEEELARFIREYDRASVNGANRPGHPHQVKVAEIIEDYVRERQDHMTDGGETIMYAARPLAHYFAADTMLSLTPNRVRDYWVWRRAHSVARTGDDDFEVVEQPISDGTIIRELAGVLRPAIKHAINERRLIAGVYDVPVPTQPPSRDYWITRSEAARLLREMKRDRRARLHLPLYTLIAVFTGARRGAILGLLWTQVDLINGQIDFNPPGRAQTSKRRSKIPVPRLLLAALRRAHARASSNNVIAYQGNPVLDIKTGFNSAAERAGLPQCSSHTLRHTAGTWISQRGVPLWEIAGYLGHSETRTTELYAHHSPEHLATAKRAMEGKHERHPLLGSQARTRES